MPVTLYTKAGADTAFAPAGSGGSGGSTVVDASTTAKGIVELATTAETTTGTDTVRAVTPAGLKAVADTKVNGLNGATGLWMGTQDQYNALGTYVATVLYIITS